uniref:Sulfotransferase n=1 Tax=Oryza punctata TaxID=4537 RepID=A0A0E0LWU9_ORYPU
MAQGQLDTESVVPTAAGDEEDDILASLPTREGWWTTFVLYHGCWMTQQAATSVSLVRAQFAPRPHDLKALSFTVANRSRHPVGAGAGDHPLLTQSPHDLVPFIEVPFRHLHPLSALDALPSPRLLSPRICHPSCFPGASPSLAATSSTSSKDVVVSIWHYMNKSLSPYRPINKVGNGFFLDLDRTFELFIDGFSLNGPIWEHCLGYWKKSIQEPDTVLFLKYDDMMADPAGHVKKLAEFLRVPFTDDEVGAGVVKEVVRLCSFEKLSHLPVNSSGVVDRISGRPMENSMFFRKGKVGDWKNYLTEEMANKMDAVIEEKLKESGLTF